MNRAEKRRLERDTRYAEKILTGEARREYSRSWAKWLRGSSSLRRKVREKLEASLKE